MEVDGASGWPDSCCRDSPTAECAALAETIEKADAGVTVFSHLTGTRFCPLALIWFGLTCLGYAALYFAG